MNIASTAHRPQTSQMGRDFQPASQPNLEQVRESAEQQDRFIGDIGQGLAEGLFGLIGGAIGATTVGVASSVGAAAFGATGWETAGITTAGILLGGAIGGTIGVYSQR